MNIRFDVKEMAEALNRALSNKLSTLGQHVLVCRSGDRLAVSSTDAVSRRTDFISGEIDDADAIGLEITKLRVATNGLSGAAKLSGTDRIVFSCGRSRFVIPSLPSHLFPKEETDACNLVAVDPTAIADAIVRVAYAVGAKKDHRLWVRGILISADVIAATNGVSMAIVRVDAPKMPRVIVPVLSARALAESMHNESANVFVGEKIFRVAHAHGHFSSRVVDTPYPILDKFLGMIDGREQILINRAALVSAVSRIIPFSEHTVDDGTYMLDVSMSGDTLRLSATIDGESCEEVVFDGALTSDIESAIDPTYLRDALNAIGGDTVRWLPTRNDVDPHIFLGNSDDIHFVMPQRRR